MKAEDVRVIQKRTAYQGYFRIDQYILKHKLFEGGWGTEISREVLERGHAACCLLYDPDLDQVVLIEQFRPGAYAALETRWYDKKTDTPWQIEVVAGVIEGNEHPEDVIRRESVEESGCQIHDIELIHKYLVTSGCSSETQFLFCAKVDASDAPGIHGLVEEGENIRVFSISTDKAFEMLDRRQFQNATLIIAMYWFRENRQRLRQEWATNSK